MMYELVFVVIRLHSGLAGWSKNNPFGKSEKRKMDDW